MTTRPFPDFIEVVRQIFGFLHDEYACVLDAGGQNAAKTDEDVLFMNRTTFVNVHLERRDFQIIVYVGPLRDGKVPPRGRDWLDLEFLLFARGIPFPTHRGRLTEIRQEAGRRREAEEYAVALRLAADDLLKGNFEVVSLIQSIKEERRRFQSLPAVRRGRLL
jgi:hypothetical protein